MEMAGEPQGYAVDSPSPPFYSVHSNISRHNVLQEFSFLKQ